MRVDKFLKLSRIIIRRTIAKQACEGGRVLINGKVAKASDNVKIGDTLEVKFGNNDFKCIIKDIKDHVAKNDTDKLIEIIK